MITTALDSKAKTKSKAVMITNTYRYIPKNTYHSYYWATQQYSVMEYDVQMNKYPNLISNRIVIFYIYNNRLQIHGLKIC